MSFSNNVNDVDKVFTKTDLLDINKEELTYLGLKKSNSVLVFDKDNRYITFRYCPRTNRLQFRYEGKYNFRLLQNCTRDELVILTLDTLSTIRS